jgi:hypothetical protein
MLSTNRVLISSPFQTGSRYGSADPNGPGAETATSHTPGLAHQVSTRTKHILVRVYTVAYYSGLAVRVEARVGVPEGNPAFGRKALLVLAVLYALGLIPNVVNAFLQPDPNVNGAFNSLAGAVPLTAMLGAFFLSALLIRSIRNGPVHVGGTRAVISFVIDALAFVAALIAVGLTLTSWIYAFARSPSLSEGLVAWMTVANPADNWLGYLVVFGPAVALVALARLIRGDADT